MTIKDNLIAWAIYTSAIFFMMLPTMPGNMFQMAILSVILGYFLSIMNRMAQDISNIREELEKLKNKPKEGKQIL